MANKKITYGIGFNVDKSGLEELKRDLKMIQSFTEHDLKIFDPSLANKSTTEIQKRLTEVHQTAADIGTALQKSFNTKLDTISLQDFERHLQNTATGTIPQAAEKLKNLGDVGKKAFFDLSTQLLTTKRELRETHSWLDKMSETLTNTVRWKIASGAIDAITGSISNAWNYAKRLDTSLNDIRIVTGKSADEMDRFARKANQAAKSLGAATTNYSNAALIYYQQGLNEEDVAARAGVTVKAANVTGQSASEVSEQLTAVWNGYKVVAEEAELYVDKLAAVAAETAADLEELSTGMSKVASAASTMGVDVDQLSAQLSTIISVTRQDAAVVGTALKTIYARMGDLKVDGVDEFGTSLGEVSGQLQQMGINVLDQQGNLREMGDVIEEVAAKWGTWTDAQQQAAAVAIAGKRQYNNLIALFENWDMYESSLTTSQTSAGTLQKQQDIYMDSLEAHLNKLTAASERLYDALINNESMNGLIDFLTLAVDLAGTFVESIGGANNILMALGPLFSRTIGKSFGSVVSTEVINFQNKVFNKRENAAQEAATSTLRTANIDIESEDAKTIIALKQKQIDLAHTMTAEELNASDARINAIAQEIKKLREKEQVLNDLKNEQDPNIDKTMVNENIRDSKEKQISILKDSLKKLDLNETQGYTKEDLEEYTVDNLEALKNRRKSLQSLMSGESKDNPTPYNSYRISGLTKDATPEQIKEAGTKRLLEYDEIISKLERIKKIKEELNILEEEDIKFLDERAKLTNKETLEKEKELTTEELIKKTDDDKEFLGIQISSLKQGRTKEAINLKNAEGTLTESATQTKVQEKNNQKYTQNLEKTFDILKKSTVVSDELALKIEKLDNAYKKAKDNTKITAEAQEKLEKELEEVISSLEDQSKALGTFSKDLKETANDIDEANNNINKFNDEQGQEDFKKGIEARIQSITNFIGYAMSLVAVWNTLQNLGNIWNDEDLTTGEKITQTITGIFSALMTLLPVISAIGPTILASSKTGSTGFAALGASGSAAGWSLQAAFWPVLLIGLAIVSTLLIAVGLFALFGKKSETNLEKAQKAFDKAKKSAEDAKNTLSELRDEYNGILSDLSQYNTAKDALDQMREGTEEWKQAVSELNMQVLELLDKYPELMAMESGYTYDSESGIYSITQEGWDAIIKQQQEAIANQKTLVAATSLDITMQQQNLLQEQKKDNIRKLDNYVNAEERAELSSAGITSRTYATGQYVYNPAGAPATPIYNTVLDEEALASKSNEELLKIQENLKTLELDPELKTEVNNLIDTLMNTNDQLKKNENVIDQQTDAYLRSIAEEKGIDPNVFADLAKQALTNQENADNKIINASLSEIKNALTLQTDKNKSYLKSNFVTNLGMTEEDFNQYFGNIDDHWIDKSIDFDDPEHVKKYVQSMVKVATGQDVFISESSLKDKEVKNFGEFEITLNDGTVVTYDEILTQAAQKIQEDQISKITEGLEADVDTLSSQNKLQKAAYFMSGRNAGNLWDDATISQIQTISNYDEVDKTDLSNFLTSFYTEANAALKGTGFSAESSKFLNFTQDDFIAFSKNINNATAAGGGDAIKGLFNSVNDPEQIKIINDELSKVNWANPESINQFRNALYDAGINIDENAVSWDTFMKKVNSGTQQWLNSQEVVITNLQTIKEVAEDISVGDIISDEEYKKLRTIAPEITDMFIKTADGYKSLVSGADLSKVLKQNYQDLQNIKSTYETIDSFQDKFAPDGGTFNLDLSASEDAEAYFDTLFKTDGASNFLTAAGIDETNLRAQLAASKNGDTSAQEYLKNVGEQINQMMIDASEGYFKSEQAQELWATSIASSWSEVLNNKDNLDPEVLEKAEKMWKNTYLTELGLSLSETLVDKIKTEDLEKAIEAARKLELDYFIKINAELDKFGLLIDQSFGLEKQKLLQEQIELQKDNYTMADAQQKNAQTVFNTELGASGYKDIYDKEGIIGLLNARADISASGGDITNLDTLIASYGKVNETAQAAAEASQAVIDAQIESFKYTLDIQKQYKETVKEWKKFSQEFDKFTESAGMSAFGETSVKDIISNLIDYNNTAYNDYATNNAETALSQMQSWKDGGGTDNPYVNATTGEFNEALWQEDYDQYLADYQSYIEDMRSSGQELYDSWFSALEEISAMYDREIEKLSSINSLLESSASLNQLFGNSSAQYYKQIRQNAEETTKLYGGVKAVVDAQGNVLQEAIPGLVQQLETQYNNLFNQDGTLKEDVSPEQAEAVWNAYTTAKQSHLDAMQAQYDAILVEFDSSLKDIIDNAFKSASGLGIDNFSEAWELEKSQDAMYFDDVNAEYEMYKFEREIQKSIDATDNIAAQNKLKDVLNEQLAILKEKDKLSQYDIDRANAMYDLTLKQIALEEAQQTANKMKLTRDAMGNYTYQYVADEDKIAQAEEELAAAQNNLYNLEKDHQKELIDNYISYWKEFKTAMAENVADEAMLEKVRSAYIGEDGFLTSIEKDITAFGGNLESLTNILGENISTPWMDTFNSLADIDTEGILNSVSEVLNGTEEDKGVLGALSEVKDAYAQYQKDENDIVDRISGYVTNLTTLNTNATDLAGKMTEASNTIGTLVSNISTLVDNLEGYADNYTTWLEDAIGIEKDKSDTNKATDDNTDAIIENTKVTQEFTNAIGDFVTTFNKSLPLLTTPIANLPNPGYTNPVQPIFPIDSVTLDQSRNSGVSTKIQTTGIRFDF